MIARVLLVSFGGVFHADQSQPAEGIVHGAIGSKLVMSVRFGAKPRALFICQQMSIVDRIVAGGSNSESLR